MQTATIAVQRETSGQRPLVHDKDPNIQKESKEQNEQKIKKEPEEQKDQNDQEEFSAEDEQSDSNNDSGGAKYSFRVRRKLMK